MLNSNVQIIINFFFPLILIANLRNVKRNTKEKTKSWTIYKYRKVESSDSNALHKLYE